MATAPTIPSHEADRPQAARSLFTVEQLTEHARLLAVGHQSVILPGPNGLLERLNENERLLREYNRATYTVDQARRITPASEWILDNFYLIEEQIQMARRHLPKRYSRELPRLVGGRSAGLPRVYDIVLGFVSHVDAQLEVDSIAAFLSAYQVVTPLKLGELWAVPIMIRLALIENLRRITDRLNVARADRDLADEWALRLESTAENQPSQVVMVVADMARGELPLSSSFVAEFYQRLSRSAATVPLARSWLEQRLAENHLTIEQLVRADSQRQAADQVSISHTITGLRMLSAWDWRSFVESASIVERILRTDPADVYRLMDFATRDAYRHAVETQARHCGLTEADVADRAVRLAEAGARDHGREDRTAHVGFYLVAGGRPQLEEGSALRWPVDVRIERMVLRFPLAFYLGGILCLTILGAAAVLVEGRDLGISARMLAGFTPVLLLCFSQLAVAVVNWLSTVVTGPRLLPRLDFSEGIEPDCRTFVVVPALVLDAEAIEHLVEALEIHYLSNRDKNLHFALLTDFPDADSETLPGDADLCERLRAGITGLNAKYGSTRGSLFHLFHRPRKWNQAEGRWMGYERKRGKIAEFNALLRGGAADAFSIIIGDPLVLPGVKFVITLDADTQLPRNAARLLVATMAHPLNRPRFDAEKGIVVDGYGILQPRVGVSLPGAGRSWFSQLFSGDVGIDPYTKGISDVYQDVFQEGSYIGKGIYDVDAFEKAIGGRIPDNSVLSHDLLESCYARSAIVSDVELYEEFPSRYNADVKRRHRWIRGDWQIAQWLLRRVPGGDVRNVDNPISALSQWKILDNLRRSLVPLALLLLLAGSWTLLPGFAGRGTLLVLAIVAAPTLLTAAFDVTRKPRELPFVLHVRSLAASVGRQFGQILITMVFLPYDAYVSTDAIVRTLVRIFVTRRRLLEWVTSGEEAKAAGQGLGGFYAAMWFEPFLAVAMAAGLAAWEPWRLSFVSPMIALWVAAPFIAWRISRSIDPKPEHLSESQTFFMRATARKTWHFFETFVTAEENWLPPDNFQEQPVVRLASRTSPTNMGLALLSNLAARDFGYLCVGELLRRTEDAVASMERLERHSGHFYNWYDTRTLAALEPLYVSAVDSGNLAGHLLTLGPGLRELADLEILPKSVFAGLCDTCGVLVNTLSGRNPQVDKVCAALAGGVPGTLRKRFELLGSVSRLAAAIADVQPPEAATWAARIRDSAKRELDDVLLVAPWLAAAREPVQPEGAGWADAGPTLAQLADPSNRLDGAEAARSRIGKIEELFGRVSALAEMDFAFLFDPARKLFATGYNASLRKRDNSYYDLLASECRMTSYVAVAQGQVPQEHWFALSRLLVSGRGEPTLASWSGSMFEYLMPLLVMPDYENTLLGESCRGAVERQIEYGRLREVPWGISESGYNLTDAHLNYQYKAFGVPGLGLKRGLAEDLVIAPYATLMALMISPREACENLERLVADERTGAYGFYEAVDYTPSRMPVGQVGATVRSYMVHHQAMGFLSLASYLLDRPMQRRFMACPVLRTSELLLQERVPHATAKILSKELEVQESRKLLEREAESAMRVFTEPSAQAPEVHLLSNGRYHLVVSQSGGGYSRWRDLAVTRWREDPTRDCWGTYIYLRDTATNESWSAAPQPALQAVKRQETVFAQGRAEFRHNHLGLDVFTEISVSPEDDVEVRRVTITNPGHSRRTVELTGYFEVVLAPPGDEAAHPAFSNLFVQTEFLAPESAVLCTRRARSDGEKPPWLFSLMPAPAGDEGIASCETDRSLFLGRGNSPASPAALLRPGPMSNTAGPVLDPAVALRRTVTIPPNGEVMVALVLGVAETRAAAVALIEKYKSPRVAARTFELAWTHSQVTLRQLNASEAQAQLYARLASALVYAQPARRANPAALTSNRGVQAGLWRYGISGDLPIALVVISDASNMEFVQQLVQAHAYWRVKGLSADLVVLNGDDSTYRQPLHEEIIALVTAGVEAPMLDKPGGIFVLRFDQIPPADRALLQAAARIVLMADAGPLEEQLEQAPARAPMPAALRPVRAPGREPAPASPVRDLIHHNGLGGFTRDGREYVITLAPNRTTPAPWINVIANADFGTVVSESGSSYSWAVNCHEFRLTPWHNDPVIDPAGEAFYLRDEETGQFWSPTPLPARGVGPYTIRHGFGYSVFEHAENGLASELSLYVAMDAPVKFAVCKVRNISPRPRRVSVTGYWEWVLGDLRQRTLLHVQTEVDQATGALLARNRFHGEFADRIAFVDAADSGQTMTGDRLEFLGRNGTLGRPAALQRARLSGRVGAGMDPAGAVQLCIEIPPGQEREVVFRLGAGRSIEEVHALVGRFRAPGAPRAALEQVWEYWGRTLGTVNVDTPDSSVNVLVNGWLIYQVLCCRLWARTGFYQSGGAFGFRDQLQDVMALVHAEPGLTREHLLRAASRQYVEGDVQHWWHPPGGRGVRTRVSDDYLWLPYAACRYSSCVGDTGVWDEVVPFLEGRPLKEGEESYYDMPARSQLSATLYDHCRRAVEHGLRFGAHGLPLMGSGDWNDGMNLVGINGRGESVWLAFFLIDVLRLFAGVARDRSDTATAQKCEANIEGLRAAVEREAWDGAWYRRAYFDDGSPLGSAGNPECQIDSLPQSWSVLSGAGEPSRSRAALDAVDDRLVREEAGLIQLFDPPFNRSDMNPGYIKGYIPGVRENGGQYTHAAIWTVMAFALRGDHERAWELFQLLNPVRHGGDAAGIETYKSEPYVVAADVYAIQPRPGRGGWTWYTGSAGWMYRTLVETLLGVNLQGESLRLAPRLPKAWKSMKVHYRYRHTVYHITFSRVADGSTEPLRATLDGLPLDGDVVPLVDDRREHSVEMPFGRGAAPRAAPMSELALEQEAH
jgi:cyclic beta-1,2-glucan glucanotransferase